MDDRLLGLLRIAATAALGFAFLPSAQAQFAGNSAARPLVTGPVIETNLVRLVGNVRPEANPANDLGPVPDSFADGPHVRSTAASGGSGSRAPANSSISFTIPIRRTSIDG